jgi:gliding motility-associated protein GldM
MAGGKQSARQKMINLMYLVFIAMLALNMSKEVLTAFGIMDERLNEANVASTARNLAFMENLATKAAEQPEQYSAVKEKADQINDLSTGLTSFIEDLKNQMMAGLKPDEITNYERQDQSDFLDQMFFNGENISKEGKAFLAEIDGYREGMLTLIGTDYPSIALDIEKKFSTADVRQKSDNIVKSWLEYQFQRNPMIASKTKLTQMQADVKTTQSEILSKMLGSQQEAALSFTQYNTLLEQSKSAFYAGEAFDGGIVLGRKDPNTKPNRVELTLDGKPLSESQYTIESGKVKLNINAGAAGDHKLEGNLIFLQDGKEVEIPVSSSFTTINKPNAAVIAADKMNVVYRGVTNPITVSIPGVPDDKVNASVSSSKKWSKRGNSGYDLEPGIGQSEITITATGTLPDGQIVRTPATFRVKDIPRPMATIDGQNGEDGPMKFTKRRLNGAKINGTIPNFDFDLPIEVYEFYVSIRNVSTLPVTGNMFSKEVLALINRQPRGTIIDVIGIKARIVGNSEYPLTNLKTFSIELTD